MNTPFMILISQMYLPEKQGIRLLVQWKETRYVVIYVQRQYKSIFWRKRDERLSDWTINVDSGAYTIEVEYYTIEEFIEDHFLELL